MTISVEIIFIGVSLLLLISVLASKITDRLGVPALLLFLLIGMLAGSDGPGGIYFDDPGLAQFIGVVALILILFSGGLDTEWKSVRPVLREGLVLATLGVLITTVVLGGFIRFILGFSWLESLLVGAIVSSTDAAAVFSVLGSRGVNLKGRLKPLLELESGSNDPMAVFLTIGLLQLIMQPNASWWQLVPLFIQQMAVGAAAGYVMGLAAQFLVNRVRLGYEGLYPVLVFALVFFTYGVTNALGGSGFLAVYLLGVFMGRQDFIHKRSLLRFYDGMAWLMQIAMFLTLGLLVFPSRLVPILEPGLLVAAVLLLVARPASVFISLLPFRLESRQKLFLAWVGLRGAVPIVLATYPLLARLPKADLIFNIVFFVVLTSVLLQGTSIPFVARLLKVEAPLVPRRTYPIEYVPDKGYKNDLKELPIADGSPAVGKAIVELGLPAEFLVILIARENDFILPSGGTVLQAGDTLLVLSEKVAWETVQAKMATQGEPAQGEA